MLGVIRKAVRDKGYGFITGDDGNDYFFHMSKLVGFRWAEVEEGQNVEFDEGETDRGLAAEHVERV